MQALPEILVSILGCLGIDSAGGRQHDQLTDRIGNNYPMDLKADVYYPSIGKFDDEVSQDLGIDNIQEVAEAIFSALQQAEKPGRDLDIKVEGIVNKAGGWHGQIALRDIFTQAGGWRERIAQAVLLALIHAIEENKRMSQAMSEAYQKASDAAAAIWGWAKEHPDYATAICVVIALGILIILAPYLIHALGFGVEGVVEGSWAAIWQSTYRGVISRKSLFSYLQSLGALYK